MIQDRLKECIVSLEYIQLVAVYIVLIIDVPSYRISCMDFFRIRKYSNRNQVEIVKKSSVEQKSPNC